MNYEDFEVTIFSAEDGGYRVLVSDADHLRDGDCGSSLPFDAARAETLFEDHRASPVLLEDPLHPAYALGLRLFASLFGGDAGRLLRQRLELIRELPSFGEPRGLRIRLLFGLPSSGPVTSDRGLSADYIRFGALPWEFLCDDSTGRLLALDPETPLVRTLDGVAVAKGLRAELPFRVLVASAAPRSLGELEVGEEVRRLRCALSNRDVAEVTYLEDPTVAELGRKLKSGHYHAFHFIGHGGFNEESGTSWLTFRNHRAKPDTDDCQRVPAVELAELLAGCPDLRLVVLNACLSGTLPRQPGHNPWQTCAAALSSAGIPAVIAMQYRVSDGDAIAFSGVLYERLGEGMAIEEALTKARLAMDIDAGEWATPTLFLRGKDGRILRLEGTPGGPLSLGIRSFEDWNRDQTENADRVLSLSRYFAGRKIKDPAAWNRDIGPDVRAYVRRAASERRPLDLLYAAHQSIAFAVGHFLEAKSGVTLRVLQPTVAESMGSTSHPWHRDHGELPAGELWQEPVITTLNAGEADMAVAISVTWEIAKQVEQYIRNAKLLIGRLVHFTVPEPRQDAVRGGAHAWQLAQKLAVALHSTRTLDERRGVLHVFASAPNAFLTFFGQLGSAFGQFQLYEFDKESADTGTYTPSLRLPLPASKDTPHIPLAPGDPA